MSIAADLTPDPPAPLEYRRRYVGWKLEHPWRLLGIVVAILGLVGGFFAWHKYEQWRGRQAVAAIQEAGGIIVRNSAGEIDRIYLSSPRIGDAELQGLAGHLGRVRAREIDLVGGRISDEGLRRLHGRLSVAKIHIFETRATEGGITDFAKSLPRTQIKRTKPDPVASQLAARDVHRHAVVALAFTPDGDHLLSGSGDGKLRVWDLTDGTPRATVGSHGKWLFSIALSPDGAKVATGGGDHKIQIYSLASLLNASGEEGVEPVRTLIGHADDVHAVSFVDDNTLVSAGDDRTLRYWNAATGEITNVILAHDRAIPSLATSRSRGWVATGSRDNTARTWDLRTGRLIHTLVHGDDVNSVAFSPDGNSLASASYDGAVRVWDAASGELRRELRGHEGRVFAVAFDPSGQRIISGGADGTVRLWGLDGTQFESSTDQQLPAAIAFWQGGAATSAAEGTIVLRARETLAVRRRLLPDYEPVVMKP